MKKTSFFIVGKHAVTGALKNPKRKVLTIFLTEDSKKKLNRDNPQLNLLKNVNNLFAGEIHLVFFPVQQSIVERFFD